MNVEVYSTPYCPFCVRAKMLLEQKGIAYTEIDVAYDHDLRNQLVSRTGRTTVPQIFIDGKNIGGFEELDALNRTGRLDQMLSSSP